MAIDAIDPATGTVSATTAKGFYYGSRLFASPVAPNILVSLTNNDSPNTAVVYDVSGSTPTFITSSVARITDFCSGGGGDMAFTPDGADAVFACAGTQNAVEVELRTLDIVRTHQTGAFPISMAISSSGQIAVGVQVMNTVIDVFD